MVYQEENFTCGNNCVRNIFNIISKRSSYSTYYIGNNLDSFSKIKNELLKEGLDYQGFKANNLANIPKEKLPAIIQVYNGTKFHFIILSSVGRKYSKIIDPQFGKIKIKNEKLKFISTGKILLLEKNNLKPNRHKSLNFINTFKYLLYILTGLLQLLSTTIFVDSLLLDSSLTLKITSASISFLSILMHNLLNIFVRKKLGSILEIYSLKANKKEDIISLSKVLDNEVTIISSTISYLIAILVSVFILCHAFFESLIPLLSISSFLFKIYLTPFINNIKRENSYYEDIAFSHLETDKKSFANFMSQAKKSSYKFLLLNLLPFLSLLILDSIYILFNLKLNNYFDINKTFYYIFISFFIYTMVDKLVSSLKKKEDTYKELNKMSLSIKSINLKKKNIIYYNNSGGDSKETSNE